MKCCKYSTYTNYHSLFYWQPVSSDYSRFSLYSIYYVILLMVWFYAVIDVFRSSFRNKITIEQCFRSYHITTKLQSKKEKEKKRRTQSKMKCNFACNARHWLHQITKSNEGSERDMKSESTKVFERNGKVALRDIVWRKKKINEQQKSRMTNICQWSEYQLGIAFLFGCVNQTVHFNISCKNSYFFCCFH